MNMHSPVGAAKPGEMAKKIGGWASFFLWECHGNVMGNVGKMRSEASV